MTRHHKGFTLSEILVVVTIIVILGLAILVGINPIAQIFKGYDSRRRADLAKIKTALEGYYSDHECYPDFPFINGSRSYVCESDFLKPYLDSMPCDPNTKKPYVIYLTPTDSTCPQQYVTYAQIYSFFDKNANLISYCPDTIEIHSPGMSNADIITGCSGRPVCPVYYGCKNGSCVIVAQDDIPLCSPYYCNSNCSQTLTLNCQSKDDDDQYIIECKNF